MCRMLACMTDGNPPEDLLPQFRRLSHEGMVPPKAAPGHVSGWGIYASDRGGSTLHYRSKNDAWDDSAYDLMRAAVGRLTGPHVIMVHLRKASVGTPRVVNCHPFVVDGRAFMHNGSIRGLSDRFRATRNPIGQTDSEKFFLLLLDSLEGRELPEALSNILPRLEGKDYTSLNFILQDGLNLYAYRHFRRHEDYYTMYYAQSGGSVSIASEPFYGGVRWNAIGNRELLCARLDGDRPGLRLSALPSSAL